MFDQESSSETSSTVASVPRPDDGSSRVMAADPVSGVAAAVEVLGREDRSGWSPQARAAHLEEMLAARERLEGEVLRAVGEWHAADGWVGEDALSPVSWLAWHGTLTRNESSDLLRAGRLVQEHSRTAGALADGQVSSTHVRLMARAAQHRESVFDDQEESLLTTAGEWAPEHFRKLLRSWQHMADDVLDREPAEVQESRSHLYASTTFGGAVVLRGLLDPEGGAILLAALDALDRPDPVDGVKTPRSLPQRRAELLVRLAQGDGPRGVNVDVIVDLARLQGAQKGDLEALRGEIVGIGPVGRQMLETLTCDCNIGRVIMRGKSMVLDLGRRTSTVSASQRRALAVRDGGCVVPGCDAPAHWCDAHHTDPWSIGGPTDLDQLELRCRRHHLAVHGDRCRPPPYQLAA
jgi:Domain of unknown function (DUF222)